MVNLKKIQLCMPIEYDYLIIKQKNVIHNNNKESVLEENIIIEKEAVTTRAPRTKNVQPVIEIKEDENIL